jgi:predicted AAA+ superfamily ATPase
LNDELKALIARGESLLARVEAMFPPAAPDPDWKKVTAARWRKRGEQGYLQTVAHPHSIALADLVAIEPQKQAIDRNTRQFLAGLPANNVLLTGSRGTGKSSLVKAMLARYHAKGLRLVEVDKADLTDLPDLADRLAGVPYRFIVFCDDLSFDAEDTSYKSLKAVLEGGIEGRPENVILYATSNRRHLMSRDMIENERSTAINPGETVEEKVSLSDRFGLWLGFHRCSQDEFLAMVFAYVESFKIPAEADMVRREALEWATTRGSRSGRVAWQYVQDLAGRMGVALS